MNGPGRRDDLLDQRGSLGLADGAGAVAELPRPKDPVQRVVGSGDEPVQRHGHVPDHLSPGGVAAQVLLADLSHLARPFSCARQTGAIPVCNQLVWR
jgi:hypothetical protein